MYRFNPFDLTKVWPHADYPLIEVGTHGLNENPQNFFAQIEQAAFSPANTVPGVDISPDRMLMARVFSYPDAQRYRVGTNYAELPVNRPLSSVHDYSHDGLGRHYFKPADSPVYAPNSVGGPAADEARAGVGSWESDGALQRTAASLHTEDDDFGQAGSLYRDVFSDEAKSRFRETIAVALAGIKSGEIQERALEYWTKVDGELGRALRIRLTRASSSS